MLGKAATYACSRNLARTRDESHTTEPVTVDCICITNTFEGENRGCCNTDFRTVTSCEVASLHRLSIEKGGQLSKCT
jgi:hypothetical protein